ncbi:MAG: 2Fe-2S iron-sulfur cluster-binding protein [Proteobacteria bacterium]|nr:2Fe-2S iron-sulfur cluster-binding protein [Pseudomonadota bacterium]
MSLVDNSTSISFLIDGEEIPFVKGQSILQAALAAGKYIPHLCYHPEFKPNGSCKLCTVKINGRPGASCITQAEAGLSVESDTPEINDKRRTLLQMLLVEGNHFCPSCEKSGNCMLQALAYDLGVMSPHFPQIFPVRLVDASHSDILLDFNRCILCEICVRASDEVDHKNVFAFSGRGITKHLIVNAESGRLADTDFLATDKAAQVCPVGVILPKRMGFTIPIGRRKFDERPISEQMEKVADAAGIAIRESSP